ncbi:ribosomal RNA small subunit methyltransferase A [Candidatus Parcubacteria bacterium]|jgi:16S rRNA (adenine1518-N6/adenine1519-N6)-dimethyltransferase|nr:ribosomal RNA small subunit methyltransferase A [Candidatus Parcubacteria bacterium]
MTLEELQFILKKHHLTPNKVRGQNFLVSDEVLGDIIKASEIISEDLILEVGPGLGALTQSLLEKAKQVVAFEIDKNFQKPLNKLINTFNNVELIWQNILSLSDQQWLEILTKYKAKDYKIVANIPYYLTAKFIQKFILADKKPLSMTLMVQKEVAERIAAEKGKHSRLSLSVALYADSKLARIVRKDNFYPQPKVDSAVIHIFNIHTWDYDVDEKFVWQLIRRGFASKRKKLFNNLLTDQNLDKEKLLFAFDKVRLDANVRAENLSPINWLELARNL